MTEATPKVANLAHALAAQTADLNVVYPGTNQPTGWIVTFAGPSHPKSMAFSDEATREMAKKTADIERAQVNGRKWKGDDDLDPQDIRRKNISNVIRRIVTWTPVDFGTGPVEFEEEAAIELFMDPAKGNYFAQFVDFLTGEKAFFKASAKG